MHSSRENSCKRENDSNKRGEYWKFDEASSGMRDTLIQSCAERVIAHAASNGGSCRQGFVKELVDELNQRAPLLKITQREVDKNGIIYRPAAVVDGHISRMGEEFLRYVNDTDSCWEVNLGASYGTELWQLHDDKDKSEDESDD